VIARLRPVVKTPGGYVGQAGNDQSPITNHQSRRGSPVCHWRDAIFDDCLSVRPSRNHAGEELEQFPLHCELETARSRNCNFQHLRANGNWNWRRFEPKFQSFLCISHSFFLGITSRGAARQLGKESGPPVGLRVMFKYQSQFHA